MRRAELPAMPDVHRVPRRLRLPRPGPQPALAPGVLEHHRRPRHWPRLLAYTALAALMPAAAWLALR
jgi:hypothetical protein